ncbi:hypothetical protein SEEH1536_11334 [Salmonella enterica subsp. enterica serovar Heidelberg str. N1536]|nr:hypothetical protein SEEH1536_11334 [Salmonella enterica subsp. enterica serovar Heidelberg str. N1536]
MLNYIFFVYSWQLIYFNRVVFYYFDKKNNILLSSFIMKFIIKLKLIYEMH